MRNIVCPKDKSRNFSYVLNLRDTTTATPTAVKVITERNGEIEATITGGAVRLKAIGKVGESVRVFLELKYSVSAVEYKTYDDFLYTIVA